MKDVQMMQFEMFNRLTDFNKNATSIFTDGSYALKLFGDMATEVSIVDDGLTSQLGQKRIGRSETIGKVEAKFRLIKNLKAIRRTARMIAKDDQAFKEFSEKFNLPKFSGERDLLATARGFLRDATPDAERFIKFELPPDFLVQLESQIKTYEAEVLNSDNVVAIKVVATAAIDAAIKRGMKIAKLLDGIMKNKFSDDPVMMAAWKRARRVEKVPKKSPTPTTVPTQPPAQS